MITRRIDLMPFWYEIIPIKCICSLTHPQLLNYHIDSTDRVSDHIDFNVTFEKEGITT